MRKCFALALILILTLLSSIMVETSFASITKPSVPQFTVKFVDSSYDVPTTYSIDPYTGANVTHPSHRVDNKTIELTIKNQPFVPYLVQEGNSNWTTSFYYNVRVKGHYKDDWITLYSAGGDPFPTQSKSDNTVITFQLVYYSSESGYSLGSNTHSSILSGLPSDAQLDFQVEAMIGAVHRGYNPDTTDQLQMFPWVFDGEESGWSNTQTVTISASAPTATPNTSPTPSTPQDTTAPTDQTGPQTAVLFGLDWMQVAVIALVGVIVAVVLIVAVVFLRKKA